MARESMPFFTVMVTMPDDIVPAWESLWGDDLEAPLLEGTSAVPPETEAGTKAGREPGIRGSGAASGDAATPLRTAPGRFGGPGGGGGAG